MPIRIVKRFDAPIAVKTMSHVIEALEKKDSLTANRRRDLICACNALARLVGQDPAEIAADVNSLREQIAGFHHVQSRISAKRLANIRADLAAALQVVGVIPPPDAEVDISVSWTVFLEKASAKHQGWALARFARYCSARQVDPEAVTDDVAEQFTRHLAARVLTNDPNRIARDTAKNFNVIVKRGGFGFGLLSTARGERYVSLPLSAYPISLQTDIARYLRRLEKPDLFSNDGPRRPLRPTSLRNIKAHLRQTLDAAVRSGYPRDRFKTLADLIDLEVLDGAVGQMMTRSGGRMPTSLLNILGTLLAIARYYVGAPEATIRSIAAAKNKISEELGGSHRSMSQKSQRRMDQFLDEENVGRIIALPDQLMKRANRSPGAQRSAMDAMVAAAIAFLLACPALRMANLASLNLKEDLSREVKGKQVFYLVHVIPQKTKGRQAIDAIIEPPLSTMIDHYLRRQRLQLTDQPKDWVFPRRSGGQRSPDQLSRTIEKKILDETGIVMNPHLFRHLAGALYLEEHPGEYESVRRLVGHAKLETTTSFYAPQSSRASFERYGRVLQRYRKDV